MWTQSKAAILVLLALIAGVVEAGQPCCPDCGCSRIRKICKLVCEMKEDIDYEYDVDCDDYCLPAPSKLRGKKWLPDGESLFGWRKVLVWQPRCECKIHTRKTLVKIPVVKKKPVYNCVVECVCCQCGKSRVDAEATAKAREQGIMPDSVDAPIVLDEPESANALMSDARRGSARVR